MEQGGQTDESYSAVIAEVEEKLLPGQVTQRSTELTSQLSAFKLDVGVSHFYAYRLIEALGEAIHHLELRGCPVKLLLIVT